jgi:hypothetical protein
VLAVDSTLDPGNQLIESEKLMDQEIDLANESLITHETDKHKIEFRMRESNSTLDQGINQKREKMGLLGVLYLKDSMESDLLPNLRNSHQLQESHW